jgi:hypothetical protein
VSKSIILPYNYRSITLYLFILLFAVTILQSSSILSPTEIKTHVAKTTTTSPQQASKNNNNNNHLAAVSSHVISNKIKTTTPPSTTPSTTMSTTSTANSNNNSSSIHKTVISKASVINPIKNSDSSSSNNNQQVSLPLSNKDNNNIDYHHYNPAIVNLTQKFNPSTISSSSPIRLTQLPSSYSSSFEKHISGKNPTMTITPRNLSTVVNDNYNHPTNVHNSIPTNNHLAAVSSHVISDKIKTATPTTPTTPTTMSTTNLPSSSSSSSSSSSIPSKNPNQILSHYYESLRISTQQQLQLQQQQQQQGQQLNSITNSNFNSDPIPIKILTANAGPDQKVKEGKKVTLHGTASDDSSSSSSRSNTDDQLNFLWKQISGKSVKLHHEDTAKAKFNAPHVKKTTKLKFQLTVYDDNGNISSDTVKIIVKSHKHSHIDKHKHHD